uniref:Uncharacterized protein n=1 Tax=Anguilla anguilla TaxID=7936 RepID=A0A0E9PTX9_ANGAN
MWKWNTWSCDTKYITLQCKIPRGWTHRDNLSM